MAQDMASSPATTVALQQRVQELEAAIRLHRDQKADDRCWLDDQEMYAVLRDGNLGDNRIGDECAMLENCKRFIKQRCTSGGPWVSYAELERRLGIICGREVQAELLSSPKTPQAAPQVVSTIELLKDCRTVIDTLGQSAIEHRVWFAEMWRREIIERINKVLEDSGE